MQNSSTRVDVWNIILKRYRFRHPVRLQVSKAFVRTKPMGNLQQKILTSSRRISCASCSKRSEFQGILFNFSPFSIVVLQQCSKSSKWIHRCSFFSFKLGVITSVSFDNFASNYVQCSLRWNNHRPTQIRFLRTFETELFLFHLIQHFIFQLTHNISSNKLFDDAFYCFLFI